MMLIAPNKIFSFVKLCPFEGCFGLNHLLWLKKIGFDYEEKDVGNLEFAPVSFYNPYNVRNIVLFIVSVNGEK